MKTFDCVLFDCSGSMSMSAVAHPLAQGADSRTLMHYALDMLFDMYGEGISSILIDIVILSMPK